MINLLPPKYKEEVKREEKWRIILNLEIFLFAFLVSFALILLAVKISVHGLKESNQILAEYERKVIELEQKRQVLLGMENLEEKAGEVNENLSQLNSFFQQQTSLTQLLQEIVLLLPPGSYLTGFSYQKKTSQVNLSGFAPDRNSLYQLKKNLGDREIFRELEFPSSNWLNPNNFTLNFKIQYDSQ